MSNSNRNTPPSEEELKREIERLRGELSSACLAISYLFGIFKILDGLAKDDMFPRLVSKFMDGGVSVESLRVMEETGITPDDFIEGANRFKERLSNHLSKLLSDYETD